MRVLAIDPGATGGFAWNDITGTRISCASMPETNTEILALIKLTTYHKPIVVMEQVSGFIGKAHPGSAMFSFGENFGFLKGIILTLGLQLVLVTPQKWQKATIPGRKKDFNFEHVLTKGKRKGQTVTKNSWKDNLIGHAKRLYPKVNVTKSTADALLILYYSTHEIQ